MFETLAPFIIAGLLFVTGYTFTRWLANLDELKRWKDLANGLDITIVAMREEGCAAMGVLQNIFNGVTAGGVPHSKLVKRIAEEAANALVDVPPCYHKERFGEQVEKADRLDEELMVARLNAESWQTAATISNARAEEAERLLGLIGDRLVAQESGDTLADKQLQ